MIKKGRTFSNRSRANLQDSTPRFSPRLNSPGSWWNLEFLGSELEDGCEGSVVGDLQHLVGQLRVGGEGDLEGDLGAATA